MSKETNYFICRNEHCTGHEQSSGNMIFQYELPSEGDGFTCPVCKSEYIESNGEVYLVSGGENQDGVVLKSTEDYEAFYNQFQTNRIYFPRLFLKDINEPDYKGRNMTFSRCLIGELIIEDVEITSAYYPVSFSECSIGKVSIKNTTINEANRKEYKSLWHFFGINFFRTQVIEGFDIERLTSRLMIDDCSIDCEINISGNSKIELALVHNEKDPVIVNDKISDVRHLLEVTGHDTAASGKKITTAGELITSQNIEELSVDPAVEAITVVENSSIQNLTFREGSTVKGKLVFRNCFIGHILNAPYSFEQDIIFFGCIFNEDMIFSKANYMQSFVVEACLFLNEAGFNDLRIENDLHLSYCQFTKNISVACNDIGGYYKSHFVKSQGKYFISDNTIGREANFRNMAISGDLELENNDIKGYIYFRQVVSGGRMEINWLNAGELALDDLVILGTFKLLNSSLNIDLRMKSLIVADHSEVTLTSITGDIMMQRNHFINDMSIVGCNSKMNIFMHNEFRGDFSVNTNEFRQMSQTDHNLIRGSLYWIGMETKDISLDRNHILGEFILKQSSAKDIKVNSNFIYKGLHLNDNQANDFFLDGNLIATTISKEELEQAYNDEDEDPKPGFTLQFCYAESDLSIKNNDTPEQLLISQSQADKLSFSNNRTSYSRVSMGAYRQLNINSCRAIDVMALNNVTVKKDVDINDCEFRDTFTIAFCRIENDFDLSDNIYYDNFNIHHSTISGSLNLKKGNFKKGLNIAHNSINFAIFEFEELDSVFHFKHNLITGNLRIGQSESPFGHNRFVFPSAIEMVENKVRNATFFKTSFDSHLCFHNNNIENDLSFREISHKMTIDFTGSFIGRSLMIEGTQGSEANGDLILDYTFVDKRISFKSYLPSSFSFINGTFNGFEIPDNWQIKRKRLVLNNRDSIKPANTGGKSPFGKIIDAMGFGSTNYLLKENILKTQDITRTNLPYSLLKHQYLHNDHIKQLPDTWKEIQRDIIQQDEVLEKLNADHGRENKITDGGFLSRDVLFPDIDYCLADYIDQCISNGFIPVYYHLLSEAELGLIEGMSAYYAETENNYEDMEARENLDKLKGFFTLFLAVFRSFRDHAIISDNVSRSDVSDYRHEINRRLEEQFDVLRSIYGSNGELKEEDAAYYKRMHYKNISDMQDASLKLKPKFWMKYLLYEKVFGWGVDLPRIVFSTLVVVVIFAMIYYSMFLVSPDLTISWDNSLVQGTEIGLWKSLVFAFQTTFSAVLGDWAPIGSGAIKIPMTINAVLGVLFVTFLIGAYGRKMLR